LICLSAQNNESRNFQASRGKLDAFAHRRRLLHQIPTLFCIQNHSLVDAWSIRFAPAIPRYGSLARGIDLDVVLSNPNRVAVVQSRSLDAKVIDKSPVETVQILNDEPAAFEINTRVIIRNRQVIDRQIVVRRPPNADRPTAYRHFLDEFFIKHQAELRHLVSSCGSIPRRFFPRPTAQP
jgi:hypothetical protein